MRVSVMDLPDIFTLLASNTKALGVTKAIHSLAENGPAKYNDEFRDVFEQMEEGKTLPSALAATALFDAKNDLPFAHESERFQRVATPVM